MSAGNFSGPVPDAGANVAPLNVLITGASRGIGLELATQYAAANPLNKVFAAVRDVRASTVVSLIRAHPNVIAVPLDVNDEASIRASIQDVREVTDRIDILINNAGVVDYTPLMETTKQTVLDVYTTNAASALTVTQTYIGLLQAHTGTPAKVVNITSVLGSNQYPNVIGQIMIAYGMSKAALNYLTTSLKYVFPDVVFLGVHPGWVQTDMTAGSAAPVTPKDCATAIRYHIANKGLTNSGEYVDNITGDLIAY